MKFGVLFPLVGLMAAEIAAAQVPEPAPASGLEIEVGGAYEHLSDDLDPWNEAFVRLQLLPAPGSAVSAELLQAERFGFRDTQVRLAGSRRLSSAWATSAEIAAAPGATVLPTFSALGNVYRDLGNGFQGGLGGRYSSYESGPVSIANGSLDYYLPELRLGYLVSFGFVDGETAPSHAGSLSRYYGPGSTFTVIVSNGESVERVSADRLLVSRTRGFAAWGVHWLSSRFAGTYGAEFTRQEDLFDRTRVQLGVRARLR